MNAPSPTEHVDYMTDADTEWGHAAHVAGIPDEHLVSTLEELLLHVNQTLTLDQRRNLTPKSPEVVSFLEDAAFCRWVGSTHV